MAYSVCLHITFKFTAPSFETKVRLNRKKNKQRCQFSSEDDFLKALSSSMW